MREVNQARTAERAAEIFRESQARVHARADRLFAKLMVLQWLAGIAAALWISPHTWIGTASKTHIHVWAAILLGGALTAFPCYLAWRHAGAVLTRHVIAVAQMMTSALLIHLTGGRIETHFHVFGSLAFFAFYRDWRVLATATVVVAIDHMARGIFWPQSVFGVLTSAPWRWMEHAGWVIFEDTFLVISIRQSLSDANEAAARRAKLEVLNTNIEGEVNARTTELRAAHADLQASEERFRLLSASAPIGIFQTDASGSTLYTNRYWQDITGISLEGSLGDGWRRAIHPADAPAAFAEWRRVLEEGAEFDGELRFLRADREVRWVHIRSAAIRGSSGQVVGHVGTVEDITERKRAEAELDAAHKKLVETSRRAGMAEVATGVLHNVGNVLNSVNVASSCVADGMRKSRLEKLERVVAMLREHEDKLPEFFATDPRAKLIPNYLEHFATYLNSKQAEALKELAVLQRNIDHIKDIVSMQQSYARVSGFMETLSAKQLVEDALQMNSSSLAHHDVRVSTHFEGEPLVTVDKQKVIQVLVNLIRNAKQACEVSGKLEKEIHVSASQRNGVVSISVKDNGVGISPANLVRIFQHGFTTRRDGHGFGLHSGALAAKEMGGSLSVCSAGEGRGATFTLELPAGAVVEPPSETAFIRRSSPGVPASSGL